MPYASRTLNNKQSFSANKHLTINSFTSFWFKVSGLKLKPGLTLIELLIAITLVGILAGIISYSMIGQQKKARDAKRKSDLQQVKRALESAKNDCTAGSYYPIGTVDADEAVTFAHTATFLAGSGVTYMDEAVSDPKNTSPYTYLFANSSSATDVCPDASGGHTTEGVRYYVLRAKLEISNDPELAKSFTSCANSRSQVTFTTTSASGDGYFYVCPD